MDKYPVAAVGELAEGDRKIVQVRGMELGIFLAAGEYRAYRNVCPHAGAPVCAGRISGTTLPSGVYEYEYGLDRQILRCPWHGWEFDLTTGRHLVDPDCKLRSYPVEVADGQIYVVL